MVINMRTIRNFTMCIEVIGIVVFIIPLNRKPHYSVYISASRLYIFFNVTIRNIPSVRPRKTIVPLEHTFRFFFGCNKRYHIFSVSIFKHYFYFTYIRKYLFNKVFDGNLFYFRKFLSIVRRFFFHYRKYVKIFHITCNISIGKQYVINTNIIDFCEPSIQRIHISQRLNCLSCIIQHLFCINRLRSFIVCRCYN